MKRSNSYF